MSILTLLLIAVGLSLDAFAVAVASGIAIRNLRLHHALRIRRPVGHGQAIHLQGKEQRTATDNVALDRPALQRQFCGIS